MIKLTHKLIHSAGTSGCGFNTAQLTLLGVSMPPKKGWLSALIGKEIPDDVWAEVMKHKGAKLSKTKRKKILGKPIPQPTPPKQSFRDYIKSLEDRIAALEKQQKTPPSQLA